MAISEAASPNYIIDVKTRTLEVANGTRKPARDEPGIWFTSAESFARVLCLDPALEDHHVVGQDSQTHVAFTAGGGFPRQRVALVAFDHRVARFNLPSTGVPASLS
jgi:hypothetical protein